MAISAYLKLDDVTGESQTKGHEKELEVLNWSWGASNTGSAQRGSGSGTGSVHVNDINFTIAGSKASAALFSRVTSHKPMKNALFTVNVGGDGLKKIMTIKLSDVVMSNLQLNSGHDDMPINVSLGLNAASIEVETFVQDAKGVTASGGKHTYSLKTGVSA